jgi:2-methylisocitrate lyase-like PEP mutase family enzyme
MNNNAQVHGSETTAPSSRSLSLKQRLSQAKIVVAPGVYDALTASLATTAGFEALYLSGAAIAYTKLGQPDIGLVTMTEVADSLTHIRERVETPIIVDADTGYGNALNVQRTVRLFERAGATAIQIEDQTFPKRCGHLSDKTVISTNEMIGKIKAALDARHNEETIVVARTDAVAVEGLEAGLERGRRYADAGADVLFVEAPRSREQLGAVTSALSARTPIMANMVEGGKTPILSASDLEMLGFSLVIFPGAIVRALSFAAQDFFEVLRRDGTTEAFRNRMFDFEAINRIVGTEAMLEHGRRYENPVSPHVLEKDDR